MDTRAIFMGTPAFALPVLEALLELTPQVVGVYTQPDKPRGRGLALEPSPVKGFALERGLPLYQPTSLQRPQAQEELAALRPEVIVVAAYGKLLPPQVLQTPPHGCLNLHPSLLPRHRGPSPVVSALVEVDEVTGVTIILMDTGMDTGPILAQREEPIQPKDTAQSLTERLLRLGAELLKETLPPWLRGELTPQAQDEAQATKTALVRKEHGQAPWHLPAQDLERCLRAYTPWPGLYTHWRGRLLKILEAVPLDMERLGAVGQVVALEGTDPAVGVVTGEGVLGLKRLQMEGRKPLDSREFLRGHQDFMGSCLPS
ncbi:MAG: methionyl-tRNA formyltransferase [Dehalococcoidia bacterium]